MGNEDKILISAYLDNELDIKDIDYVESLIANDQNAHDYLNKLKVTNNELSSIFNSEDMRSLDLSISEFVETLKPKSTVSFGNFGEVLTNFFSPKHAISYSLTAALFLAVGLFFQDLIYKEILFDLNGDIYKKQVFITRGSSISEFGLEGELKQMILEMHENSSPEGELIYGSNVYKIFFQEKTIDSTEMSCYSGNVLNSNQNQHFVFCSSSKDTSVIFTD